MHLYKRVRLIALDGNKPLGYRVWYECTGQRERETQKKKEKKDQHEKGSLSSPLFLFFPPKQQRFLTASPSSVFSFRLGH